MEEQAVSLLATLRKSSVTIDEKTKQFNALKSSIKHLRVPDAAQPTIFDCLEVAIGSQTSPTLVSIGLSTLGHLIKRLTLQEQGSVVAAQSSKILQVLLDRLGDTRESNRTAASQCLAELWAHHHAELEAAVLGTLKGTNARAKDMGMTWIVKMHRNENMQFKKFVPYLVANLEDHDGSVRETARNAVIELFRDSSDIAKTDLKKQMTQKAVRPTIVNQITSQLGLSNNAPEVDLKASSVSTSTIIHEPAAPAPRFTESVSSEHLPPAETVQMDPLYVHSQRELDEIFRDMAQHFEGKETEGNWLARDKSVLKIRRLTKGNAPSDFHVAFMANIKGLLDGILKVANTLRTTMSTNGCQLVQELARTVGSSLDSMVEILLQNFIKMTSNTKNITAQNGGATVDAIFSNATYHVRLLQHVLLAAQEKNVQPRTFAPGWLKTLIKKHAANKAQIEHSGGVDVIEKCLIKGLADANPKVRENARAAYWIFAQVWSEKAQAIMNGLDAKAQGLLQKDPNNPNAGSLASSTNSTASTKPGLGNSRVASSLRAAITAQRRQAAGGRGLPERPGSAQAILTPARQQSVPDLRESHASSTAGGRPPSSLGTNRHGRAPSGHGQRPPPPTSSVSSGTGGTLRSGPLRPPRRPELNRPATADPYHRKQQPASNITPTLSPANSPVKEIAKKNTVTKQRARTPSTKSVTQPSPSRPKSRLEQLAQPKVRRDSNASTDSRSSPRRDEDLTRVIPAEDFRGSSSRRRPAVEKPTSDDTSMAVDDDNFTMVIPTMNFPQAHAPAPRGSPPKPSTPRPSPAPGSLSKIPLPGSPIQSPRQTPKNRSPVGRGSPFRPNDEEVKVYEDPRMDDDVQHVADQELGKPVLEELPINERTNERRPISSTSSATNISVSDTSAMSPQRDSPRRQRSHHKTTSTGSIIANGDSEGRMMSSTDPNEVLRARRLLASGIDRIQSRTLEAHGFRKVQELIKTHSDLFGSNDEKLDQLFSALTDYLGAPSPNASPKNQALKAQVLATLRTLMKAQPVEAKRWHPKVLTAILKARAEYDGSEHVVNDMEKAITDILSDSSTWSDCLDSIISLMESTSHESSIEHTRTSAASLNAIVTLLSHSSTALSSKQTQRLCRIAVSLLSDMDADVRRADTELCVSLHERLAPRPEMDKEFWAAMGEVNNGQKSLITYYIHKREVGAA